VQPLGLSDLGEWREWLPSALLLGALLAFWYW
jgi:hypothetical protein